MLGWVRLNSLGMYGYILSNDRDCCGNYAGFALWGASYYAVDGAAFDVRDGSTTLHDVKAPAALSLAPGTSSPGRSMARI